MVFGSVCSQTERRGISTFVDGLHTQHLEGKNPSPQGCVMTNDLSADVAALHEIHQVFDRIFEMGLLAMAVVGPEAARGKAVKVEAAMVKGTVAMN